MLLGETDRVLRRRLGLEEVELSSEADEVTDGDVLVWLRSDLMCAAGND